MAIAITKFQLVINVIGLEGLTRSKTFEILVSGANDADRRTAAQGEMASILSTYNTVSNTHIQSYRLSEVWFDDAAVPADLASPYREMVFTGLLGVGGGKKASMNIMGPADVCYVGNDVGTGVADPASAEVLLFLARFDNDAAAIASLSDGEQFDGPTNVVASRLRTVGGK